MEIGERSPSADEKGATVLSSFANKGMQKDPGILLPSGIYRNEVFLRDIALIRLSQDQFETRANNSAGAERQTATHSCLEQLSEYVLVNPLRSPPSLLDSDQQLW